MNRRTLFRRFATKEALLAAFWAKVNADLGTRFWPESESDLTALPPDPFAALDGIAPIVQAAHAAGAARKMRLQANPERRAAFRASLAAAQDGLAPERARQLEAAVQLPFSATAWLTMKETWGLAGREAGDASAWAIGALLDAARRERESSSREEDAPHRDASAGLSFGQFRSTMQSPPSARSRAQSASASARLSRPNCT